MVAVHADTFHLLPILEGFEDSEGIPAIFLEASRQAVEEGYLDEVHSEEGCCYWGKVLP